MHSANPILSILFVLMACLAAATLMTRLKQPTMIGYIVGGFLIGPYLLGIVPYNEVSLLGELGVSLLMFTIGLELSLQKFMRVKRVAILGGLLLFLLTLGFAFLLSIYLKWTPLTAFTVACAVNISCTSVVLRLLAERAEVGSVHGNVCTGILIVQDVAAVPLLAIIPTLASRPDISLDFIGGILVKIIVFVIFLYATARFLVPKVLHAIAGTRSKELFSIAVLAICAGVAAMSQQLGLSLALGAFVAGLIVSESDFGNQAVSDILPLKDSFGAIFFASVGMLLNVSVFSQHWMLLIAGYLLLVLAKALFSFFVLFLFRYSIKQNIFVSLSLAQMGEFSLLLLMMASQLKILEESLYQFLLAEAVISIIATPYLMKLAPFVAQHLLFLERTPWLARGLEREQPESLPKPRDHADQIKLGRHIILCGYGPTGSIVMKKLVEAGVSVAVIDLNYKVIQELKADGFLALYGDCSNAHVLAAAGIAQAELLIVTIPDPLAMKAIVASVRSSHPKLPIYVRVKYNSERKKLLDLGATDVVWEEYEAGQELALRTLSALQLQAQGH